MPKKRPSTRPPDAIPASPGEAVLDRVRNPHADTNYVARFTFPEFTVMCPVTGQPDFATLVIDYVPRAWLVESKSLKLYLNSFRNHGAFHEECTVAIGKKLVALLKPDGCASAATSIRAAACRSTCSGRRESCPPACGRRIRASAPIGRVDSERAGQRGKEPADLLRRIGRAHHAAHDGDPAAPAAIISATRAALMPPMASTGTRAARAISASPLRPISGP